MHTTSKPLLWRNGTRHEALFHRVDGDRAIDEITEDLAGRAELRWSMARKRKASFKERATPAGVPKPFKIIQLNSLNAASTLLRNSRTRLLSTSSKHLSAIDFLYRRRARSLVCRKCWSAPRPAQPFVCESRHGQRIKTCLSCGTVRRFGGGPKLPPESEGGNEGMAVPNHIMRQGNIQNFDPVFGSERAD